MGEGFLSGGLRWTRTKIRDLAILKSQMTLSWPFGALCWGQSERRGVSRW